MASRKKGRVRTPNSGRKGEREAVLRRRLSACQGVKKAGEAAMIGAGLLALVLLPLLSVPPTALWIWAVRTLAVGGFLTIAVAMLFDQHYRGELVSREKGYDAKDEVFRASLWVVAAAAVPPLLIVYFYP